MVITPFSMRVDLSDNLGASFDSATGAMMHGHRSTTTTSWSSMGGKPESNLAFTVARQRPKRATVVEDWIRSLVMTSSTPPR